MLPWVSLWAFTLPVQLASAGPPLINWPAHPISLQASAEDAITPEQRIDILKDKLKDLKKNKSKYFDQVAEASVEIDQLTADVTKISDLLALQWERIDRMGSDLDAQKDSYTYDGKRYSRAEVLKQLERDFASYKTAHAELDAKKDLLNAKKQAFEAARTQLADMEKLNDEMEARLAQMKADLQRVRQREAQSGKNADDDLAKLKADMDDIGKKIAEREKALDLVTKPDKDASKPPEEKPADAGDIRKQIEDYKKAHQPDGPKDK